ncbi:autotransporter assembly complex family protein [Halomonas shantousis]
MRYGALLRCGLPWLALCLVQTAQALDAEVRGLSGPAAANVVNYLVELEAADEPDQTSLDAAVRQRTQEALRAFGYYQPNIETAYPGRFPDDEVIITLSPGPRVHITELDIDIAGDARDDEAFQLALDEFPLSEGDALRHAPYESFKSQLATLSLERGYFDSSFTHQRIEVRPWEESARIYLHLKSGPRYRFGNVTYSGSQIDEERLRRMLTFAPGEPYLAGDLAQYNQRLSRTDWFRGIAVRPRVDEEPLALAANTTWWQEVTGEGLADSTPMIGEAGIRASRRLAGQRSTTVPVDVSLIPADRHKFEVGVGYATDVGPRMRFAWDRPWINSRGHSLEHELYLSAPEQRFSGEYIMPLENPLRDSYQLRYGLESLDNEDTKSFVSAVELARHWEFDTLDDGWSQDVYLRAAYEDFVQADQENQVFLLYPGISWSRVRTRNPRFPTWGDRQRLAIEVSDPAWGSDARFVRTTFDSQWIRMLGSNNRFVGRMGVGAMATDTFEDVPPSLRFFAGGDRSVRGYSYESLSPENEEGELLGGQHLLTASLEYQRRVTGDWWGAAFVDTGNAFDAWWPDDLKTGAGLGIRWVSPVGPIRFDIAHPFDDEEDSWRLHFAIGPEF